ncbi:redox-regulated ATPase YchF [Meiothermus granaticius]|uniref:Ribosome-binding ATPase YchF n=1 Tax=Meiothermus granaticius NBRC 107808 TaxID=1227551 RepID=A0A399F7G2_9DEIN|nr:redox-regulated ATPase YchF [Meiothermus granaticius]RIH90571.1 Ribosome-binding ATPase YchF [Meiothermus granaticius NBRC 107808]GEM88290.1 ribosome-binding ATPase YchF [Meiothermus granaticius NBRC 107808]
MASLAVGIVGLPNVGKSTLFNAITKAGALAANYPFATIDKNVGVVTLPDPRLDALQRLFIKGDKVPPVVPTYVEFVDIAGLVKGAHKGEGLGNQFLANIREVAAIAHVVRCFEDPNVVHVAGKVDPLEDLETINTELALADLQTLEKRLEKLRKTARSDKEDKALLEVLEPLLAHLAEGQPARTFASADPEGLSRAARELGLLTYKPVIYVCNVAEEDLPEGQNNPSVAKVRQAAAQEGAEVVVVSAKIESELSELSEGEAAEYLQSLGLNESGLNRLVKVAYHTLGLLTFLTAGEKEVRAWTVRQGTKAPQAAGEIHSDLERGFIRAEVIEWNKLVEAGGWAQAKERGWVRTEGKEYVVQDGDVMYILFNL